MAAIWLSLALLLTPASFWLQQAAPEALESRLWLPQLTPVIDRHTPLYTNGIYLPPTITANQTIPASASPLILTGTTRVAAGATLTLEAGTHIYTAEFATLTIDGALITQGTAEQPVVFSTNEQHAANQLWNGLVFKAGSRGDLNSTTVEYATPAITCLQNSYVPGHNNRLKNTKLPIFSETARCL